MSDKPQTAAASAAAGGDSAVDSGGAAASSVNRQQVIDYLRRHPDFFMGEDDLLAALALPHGLPGGDGSPVSLLERQVAVLRHRGQDTRHKLDSLLTNARNNDQLFDITSRLVLALLQADTIEAIVATTRQQLLAQPNIDACEILLADSFNAAPGTLRLISEARLRSDYAEVFRLNRTHCGPLDEKRLKELFPSGSRDDSRDDSRDAPSIRSTALTPIPAATAPALIAFGNLKPDYFNIHLDTLFLDFIGRLLATLLDRSTRVP